MKAQIYTNFLIISKIAGSESTTMHRKFVITHNTQHIYDGSFLISGFFLRKWTLL